MFLFDIFRAFLNGAPNSLMNPAASCEEFFKSKKSILTHLYSFEEQTQVIIF